MGKVVCSLWLIAAVASASLRLVGCSAAGYAIGSAIDEGNARTDTLRGLKLRDLHAGTDVTVIMKDSTKLDGYFLGLHQTPQAVYQKLYDGWRLRCKDCAFAPELGDTLTVTLNSGDTRSRKGELVGFTFSSVMLRRGTPNGPAGSTVLQSYNMQYVDTIVDSHGTRITGEALQKTLSGGQIPTNSSAVLLVASDTVYIPVDTIDQLVAYTNKTPGIGKAVGTGVGLGIDILLIVAIVFTVTIVAALVSLSR